jgi:20S proteasome subunit alpha 5
MLCTFFVKVEYAIEAIKLGSTAIGIQTSEGVVLAVEKRITSPLMEPTTIEKIVEVDKHIGISLYPLWLEFGYLNVFFP